MQDTNKMKKPTDGSKYLQNISYKGLISKYICKNLLKSNSKIRNNHAQNSQMVWTDIEPKKIY